MKNILLFIFLLITLTCHSQDRKYAENGLIKLKKSFSNKKEKDFLENFPKDFQTFKNTFGWDDEKDSAEPLYDNSGAYIDYWFSLLQKPQYRHHETSITTISKNGKWEADAVNYFKIKSIEYIEVNKKYNLINSLSKEDAKSVISFLLDSPHPKFDSVFISSLTLEKQKIAKEFLSKNASDMNYYIQDTDGYANLRKDKNSSSKILQKINTGEKVKVLNQSGDWWLVISQEGKKGYVHKSRIKSKKSP
ncbi:glutaminase [Chryseobacterium sp. StRB126]|uniref:SH3 domain-containing protein n=1 Tax=Chryseobacterium sp. StRB126 TaxID=878220 RepID=UPI0004E988F7|nr:SH3 domain-containing protein [Chryseobacterium sp. StRB126]BAP30550.1 glutaminase [Chryseobacterium sp. StRB126]